MAFQKAIKQQSKLRLALCGLPGSGKTWTALALACAIAALMREFGQGDGRVAVIDSERGSARLYADQFDFDVCELDSYSPMAYVDKIHEAERAGYDIIIADSISHAWAGKGGALEQKDSAAARNGNSWTAWRDVTPKHNALVDAMIGCRAHFIATMRVKMEHVQETVNGKTEIRKVGLQLIQREGMEYEFTLVGDIDHTHTLKISKTRIHGIDIGDQFERPGAEMARRIYTWLMSGAPVEPQPITVEAVQVAPQVLQAHRPVLDALLRAASMEELNALIPQVSGLPGEALDEARRRYNERHAQLSPPVSEQVS